MAAYSPHHAVAEQASRFMLDFAKAQSLEAALVQVPTPATRFNSTLALLWGVLTACARVQRCDEAVAAEAARVMLADLPDGASALRWLLEHRGDEQFQAWAELGEMAVIRTLRADDSMPPLLDLAREYRVNAEDGAGAGRRTMAIPGSVFLTEEASRQPVAKGHRPEHRPG